MTAFEQELIRAIEHGCPFCGNANLQWRQLRLYDSSPYVGVDGKLWGYSMPSLVEAQDWEVWCPEPCATKLWDHETGWIPEMQEVVKGE